MLEARAAVAVYPPHGAVLIEGPDVARLVCRLVPLLDGRRTRDDVLDALVPAATHADRAHVASLFDALAGHGAVVDGRADAAAAPRRDPDAAAVVVAAPPTWQARLADALGERGVVRRGARLRDARPGDLALGVFPPSRAGADPALAFSRTAHAAGLRSIACVLSRDEVFVGPLVVPGRTACWCCTRRRLDANARLRESRDDGPDRHPRALARFVARLLARAASDALAAADGTATGCPDDRASRLHVLQLHVLHRRSLQLTAHPVLRVPGCAVCGGRTPGVRASADGAGNGAGGDAWEDARVHAARHPSGDDAATLHALRDLVDERTGLVNRVVIESAAVTGVAQPVVASALTADAPVDEPTPRAMPLGWGKGGTPVAAATTALAEALERYCAALPDATRWRCAPVAGLEGDVLDPRVFPLYREVQYERAGFPYARFDPDGPHPWVRGRWAHSGAPVWVPAILVYLWSEVTPAQLFCQGTSNGLAAHVEPGRAALSAVLELIERDAFLASWLCRTPGRRVRVDDGLADDEQAIVDGLRALGARVELTLLGGAGGYTTAVCLAFGDGARWPGVTFGLGADLNPRAAVRRALYEQGQTGPYLRRLMRLGEYPVPADARAVTAMLDHAAYYFAPARAAAFRYLTDGPVPGALDDPPPTPADSLDACARRLAGAGVRVALVDVTSADVATTPLRVVRAVSPDLQPVAFGHGLERAPVARLAADARAGADAGVLPIW